MKSVAPAPAQQTRLQRVMETYECDPETAQRYLDLRDEGYNYVQAQLMAGIGNPPEDHDD